MNESVFNDLTSMGFDQAQSRKAAMCFTDAQAAVEWIFAGGRVSPGLGHLVLIFIRLV
jgi:uncharacterized UBP type Zn finger protein